MPTEAADRIARAGLLLAAALWWLAAPAPAPVRAPCTAPVERAEEGPRAAASGPGGPSLAAACDGVGPALRGPARLLFGLRLDPNRASAEALEVLPGIGPARARAIVRERRRRRFARPADLLRVPGIGPVTLERITPLLSLATPGAALSQNR